MIGFETKKESSRPNTPNNGKHITQRERKKGEVGLLSR